MNLKDYIIDVKDHPKEGIVFKDITPILSDSIAYKYAITKLEEICIELKADVIVAAESRGYFFGCPLAHDLGCSFIPARKPGKLPRETISYKYDLEYGTNEIHIHKGDIKPGQKVIILDDLLATGGTTHAIAKLVEQCQAEVINIVCLVELEFLNGRDALKGYNVTSVIKY